MKRAEKMAIKKSIMEGLMSDFDYSEEDAEEWADEIFAIAEEELNGELDELPTSRDD